MYKNELTYNKTIINVLLLNIIIYAEPNMWICRFYEISNTVEEFLNLAICLPTSQNQQNLIADFMI